MEKCLKQEKLKYGNVEIVDILLLEQKLQKFALYVAIQKHISKLKLKIIKI